MFGTDPAAVHNRTTDISVDLPVQWHHRPAHADGGREYGNAAAFAFAMLLLVFARTDLSVKLVAMNSHSMKPLVFKVAAAWGNHEGSMLLWVTVMSVAGALIALVERRLPERTMQATLAAQGFVALGFYAFLLFSSNPFERLPVPALEGNGLNPLLQDPGLAFHPPTLYLGYVGLSVAFSLAVEIIQFALAIGVFDVTDIIMNTLGGLVGLAAYTAASSHANDKYLDRSVLVAGTMILFAVLYLRIFVFIVRY